MSSAVLCSHHCLPDPYWTSLPCIASPLLLSNRFTPPHRSLGFLVAVEISIIPATSHVRLEYTPCKTRRDLVAKFTAASKDASHDFVEVIFGFCCYPSSGFMCPQALMYSSEEGVLMTGTFADEINKEQENKIGLWFKPWFYTHVASFLKSNKYVAACFASFRPGRV